MKRLKHISFNWSNYTRPTPANLEALAVSLRRIVSAVGATTVVMEANRWIPFSILLIGLFLDECKNFFGRVNDEINKVSINIPPSVEDTVDLTHDEKQEE